MKLWAVQALKSKTFSYFQYVKITLFLKISQSKFSRIIHDIYQPIQSHRADFEVIKLKLSQKEDHLSEHHNSSKNYFRVITG